MLTKGACDLLHRLDAAAHGLPAPFVEELAGPDKDGVAISRLMQPVSPRTWVECLIHIAAMWNPSKICRASQHFS